MLALLVVVVCVVFVGLRATAQSESIAPAEAAPNKSMRLPGQARISPQQFQRKLDLTAGTGYGGLNLTESPSVRQRSRRSNEGGVRIRVGQAEIDLIKEVEHFTAKLQF